jgi:hypothetical protein
VDPLDAAILALRLALVLVLYAFLVLAVRAVSAGLREPRAEAEAPRTLLAPGLARELREPAAADGAPRALRLMVVEPAATGLPPGQLIDVPDGATLGRGRRAEVVVADPTVSSEHARLTSLGDAWLVADLGSTNGTAINQAQVRGEARLAPGDVLALGNVRL